MTEEDQGQPAEQAAQDTAAQVAVVEQAYADAAAAAVQGVELTQETFTQAAEGLANDLGQHGHAVAQLEDSEHENPHDTGGEEFQQ